jgi:hypothetical protein
VYSQTEDYYCYNYGITQVSFAGQAQASADGAAGYEDFTCRRRFQGQQGQRYPLQITIGGANRYDVRVYIDYDNNGIFDERTEVLFEALSTQNPTELITLAGPVAAAGPVRLRVTAATGLPLTACTSPVLGQVEDYSLLLVCPRAGTARATMAPGGTRVVKCTRYAGPLTGRRRSLSGRRCFMSCTGLCLPAPPPTKIIYRGHEVRYPARRAVDGCVLDYADYMSRSAQHPVFSYNKSKT